MDDGKDLRGRVKPFASGQRRGQRQGAEQVPARGSNERGPIGLISVPMDLGAGRRGVDMGPSAMRIAGVTQQLLQLGYDVKELGIVPVAGPETTEPGESGARYLSEIANVARRLKRLVGAALRAGCLPVVLGGDHSISIGTVSALAEYHGRRRKSVGVIWVDAHADMNTPETTPSGNIHGMAVSVLLGRGPAPLQLLRSGKPPVMPEHVTLIGTRSVDAEERGIVHESGARVFTMSEIDERGMAACTREALERATLGTAGVHLSFDLDAVDPIIAPGVGTPVPGGLTFREAHLICEAAAASGKLVSLEVVELNPVLDFGNRTAQLGAGLIASALGKTIL
ncbi:MAG: arginase [Gemmatimonadetes bacterium]|nr:arginase [Gemmatimonadota bacterium]